MMKRTLTSTMIVRCALLLAIAATCLTTRAQDREQQFVQLDFYEDTAALYLRNHIDRSLATSNNPRQVLKMNRLWEDEMYWTDGVHVYSSYYDQDERQLMVFHEPPYPGHDRTTQAVSFPVKGGKLTARTPKDGRYTLERIGGYTMLVQRNAGGTPVKAYYAISSDDYCHGKWTVFMHYLLMGNYLNPLTPEECNNVFDVNMPYYDHAEYSHDPGIYTYHAEPDSQYILLSYGGGRVSRGKPGYEHSTLNGAGGRGAIMGPMLWQVTPSVDGVTAIIVHDQPYVAHMPGIGQEGDTVSLPKLQTPFQDIPGKWPMASVIPLTHTILKICPKEVLTLMRGEIYARHGDTFRDPETQRYFDAQPWYRKSGRAVTLTDLERFNYQLIKQVEASKP